MQYFNITNIKPTLRVRELQKVNTVASNKLIAYLKANDMWIDFLMDPEYQRCVHIKGTEFRERGMESVERFEYQGKQYILAEDRNDWLHFYEVMPDVYDDKTFKWNEDKANGTLVATVTYGVFDFVCIKQADGKGTISVRYTKCETKHRNKVTLELIEISERASNEMFLDAIDQWKDRFSSDVSEINT